MTLRQLAPLDAQFDSSRQLPRRGDVAHHTSPRSRLLDLFAMDVVNAMNPGMDTRASKGQLRENLKLLLRITGEREEALDLSQEVFLKAYQHLRKLEDPARFAPWLFRIAHNEAFSAFRKRKVENDVLVVTEAEGRSRLAAWFERALASLAG